MTQTTMRSFAKSTGQSANSKSGEFSGALLGKMAQGLDALDAMARLAAGQVNRFMELAIEAAHVAKQTLEKAISMPFASPDMDFNPSLTPQVPGLGGGDRRTRAFKNKKSKE